MKRIVFFSLLFLSLAVAGCKSNKTRECWVSYDPIDAYQQPSDSSEVLYHLRGSYYCHTILEKDTSGKWGRIEHQDYFKKVTCWLPLEKMIYAGSEGMGEQFTSAVVKPDKMPLYMHPKKDRNDSQGSLKKNDTVQITTKTGQWAHIKYIKVLGKGEDFDEWHGWAPLAQLEEIGTMSVEEVEQYQKDKRANAVASKTKGKYKPFMAKLHPFYRKMYRFSGKWAVAMVILLLIPSFRRKLFWRLLLFLPVAYVVANVGLECVMPSWYFAFLIPFATLIYCYPLLYSRKTAMISVILYLGSTFIMSGLYYFCYFKAPKGSFVLSHVLLFLLLLAICVLISLLIYIKIDHCFCPHCKYYANHPIVKVGVLDISTENETDSVVNHTESTKREYYRKTVITDKYEKKVYDTETKTIDREITRKCMKCGHEYRYEKTEKEYSSTERPNEGSKWTEITKYKW